MTGPEVSQANAQEKAAMRRAIELARRGLGTVSPNPVVGCVVYRGYFSEAGAENYARRLRFRGNDVEVGGVAAYSTLGHFRDPLLNTMMSWSDAQIAEEHEFLAELDEAEVPVVPPLALDGRTLAATWGRTLLLYDTPGGRVRHRLEAADNNRENITAVAFAPSMIRTPRASAILARA